MDQNFELKLVNILLFDCRYSESLYALFSVGGLYHLISGKNSIAVLLLALSGCARSNGMLNAGYVCFQTMHLAYVAVLRKRPFVSFYLHQEHVLYLLSHYFTYLRKKKKTQLSYRQLIDLPTCSC